MAILRKRDPEIILKQTNKNSTNTQEEICHKKGKKDHVCTDETGKLTGVGSSAAIREQPTIIFIISYVNNCVDHFLINQFIIYHCKMSENSFKKPIVISQSPSWHKNLEYIDYCHRRRKPANIHTETETSGFLLKIKQLVNSHNFLCLE